MKADKIKYSLFIEHEYISLEIMGKLGKLVSLYYVKFTRPLSESLGTDILQVEAEFISLEQMFNFNKELEEILC